MRSILRTVDPSDLRDALIIAAAIGLVGASFGALAASAGLSIWMAVGMSTFILAGGSQFLAVGVVAAGGGVWTAVIGGLLLNLRHLPFGLAMSDVVGARWASRLVGAHLLIDEVVAFSRARRGMPGAAGAGAEDATGGAGVTDGAGGADGAGVAGVGAAAAGAGGVQRAREAYWVCGIALALFWNLGTLVGAAIGQAVPDPNVFGVDAAFPAALLALLLPTLRTADVRRVALLGAAVAVVATPWLPPGLPVLLGLVGLVVAGRYRGTRREPGRPAAEQPESTGGRPEPECSDPAGPEPDAA